MSNMVKPFFAAPLKHTTNAFVASESRCWAYSLVFAKSWLVMDLGYLAYFLANTSAVLLGLVSTRINLNTYCIKTIRIVTFAVIHLIVLIRLRGFEDVTLKLVTGQLNRWEDRDDLKKRIYRCLYGVLFAATFLFSLNLAEAIIAFQFTSFLYQLVDFVTFGNAEIIGEFKSRLVLLVDNVFYTGINSSMVALWIWLVLFALTLSNAVTNFKKKIESVPFLTEANVNELHEAFDSIQRSIQSVDHLFSPLLFLWYFDALVSAFNGILYFMEGSLGAFSSVYATFNFFVTSVAVLGLTYVASMIPINVQETRSTLLDKARKSKFDNFSLNFFLFYKRLGVNRNGLTAAGFFLINRNVCLSFIGFLVTYLIVLYTSGTRNPNG